ncbi:MAG TPA: hypothetical protein VF183_13300 [Acidimicrobiales bacterium]
MASGDEEDDDGVPTVALVIDDLTIAVWPLDRLGPVDLSLVDILARLQLGARRDGCAIRVRNPSVELRGLLELAGLADELLDRSRGCGC